MRVLNTSVSTVQKWEAGDKSPDGRGSRAASAYAMSNAGNLHATTVEPANVAEACAGL